MNDFTARELHDGSVDTHFSCLERLAPRPECFACIDGYVFIGHMVEGECGEDVEVVEAVPCRRCAAEVL